MSVTVEVDANGSAVIVYAQNCAALSNRCHVAPRVSAPFLSAGAFGRPPDHHTRASPSQVREIAIEIAAAEG